MCLNSQNHVIYAIRAECRTINFNFQLPHGAKAPFRDSIEIQNTIQCANLHATLWNGERNARDGEMKSERRKISERMS